MKEWTKGVSTVRNKHPNVRRIRWFSAREKIEIAFSFSKIEIKQVGKRTVEFDRELTTVAPDAVLENEKKSSAAYRFIFCLQLKGQSVTILPPQDSPEEAGAYNAVLDNLV